MDSEMEAIERALSEGRDHEAVAALADAAGYVKNMTWTMDMEAPGHAGAGGSDAQ